MRRLERGASFVPLIIVIVLLLVALVWAYVKHDEADKLKIQVAQLKADLEEQSDQRVDLANHARKVGEKVGWLVETETDDKKTSYGTDPDRVEAWIANMLASLKEKYVWEVPSDVYSVDPNGGIQRESTGDKLKIEYMARGAIPSTATLEDVFKFMDQAMGRMLNDVQRQTARIKDEQANTEQAKAEYGTTLAEKDQTIAQLRSDYNGYVAQATAREQELQQENISLDTRRREAEEALDDAKKEAHAQQVKDKNEILGLEQERRKLLMKKKMVEEPIGPDGEVLAVTAGQGLVMLNRGKADHLKPGTKFDVYTLGKGARKVYKGAITVLEVMDDTAKARVTVLLDEMTPIVPGDLIESVTYNPKQVLQFVLLGQFRKYGQSDAARRLKDLGMNVATKVTIDTDYLVIGAPEREDENLADTDTYKMAKELGVPIITEDQLSRFLQY